MLPKIRVALLMLLIGLLVDPFMTSAGVDASSVQSPYSTTCSEIRVENRNGVAFSKKYAKRQKRAPKVDRALYTKLAFLDFNRNGVICDQKDVGRDRFSVSYKFEYLSGGIPVNYSIDCLLFDFKLEYGSVVGMAYVNFGRRCSYRIENRDRIYTLPSNFFMEFPAYLVFSEAVSSSPLYIVTEGEESRSLAAVVADLPILEIGPRLFKHPTLSPQKWHYQFEDRRGYVYGERSLIESLYSRIRNGLQPRLYYHASVDGLLACVSDSVVVRMGSCQIFKLDNRSAAVYREVGEGRGIFRLDGKSFAHERSLFAWEAQGL